MCDGIPDTITTIGLDLQIATLRIGEGMVRGRGGRKIDSISFEEF